MPNFILPAPTGDGVRNLHIKLINDWGPRLKLDKEFRDLIRGTQVIETLEKNVKRNIKPLSVHMGRAGGTIEHANGLIMASPSFHVEPIDQTTESLRDSESIERAAARMFERQLIATDFWAAAGRDILSYGRTFIKSLISPAEWTIQTGYPVRKNNETAKNYLARIKKWKSSEATFPFVINHIPAMNILAMVSGKDTVEASIEEKFIAAYILAEELRDKSIQEAIEKGHINWYDQLSVVEYIDKDWVGYFLTSMQPRDPSMVWNPHESAGSYTALRTWNHGIGAHPVILIPGLINSGEQEYVWRYKSYLADAKEPLELFDMLCSRLATMVWAYYLPSYVWTIAASTTQYQGRKRPTMEVNLGGVTTKYQDEALDPLPVQQSLPADAATLLATIDEAIQRNLLDDVLFGRVPGSAPAYQVQLRIQVARAKFTPIAQNMARGIVNIFNRVFRGIEQLGEDVDIAGEILTPALAKTYKDRLTVSIQPKNQFDRNQAIGTANLALQFGLPWDWIVENILDIEDPATLRLMNDIRELENAPQTKERLLQDALEQLDMLIEQEEYEEVDGIRLDDLPPEFVAALQQLKGTASQPPPVEETVPSVPGEEALMEEAPVGLGRGPYPPGAAPQTIAPRGLNTPNTQPGVGSSQAGTENPLLGLEEVM